MDSTYKPVVVDKTSFALNGSTLSYRFHVDETSKDLVQDHFGGHVSEDSHIPPRMNTWSNEIGLLRREFPDVGRGDFRPAAIHIKQSAGHTITEFKYVSHDVVPGKPSLPGLPSTFGDENEVTTLIIHMYDETSAVAADLSYSIFPKYDAIARSVKITNRGEKDTTIEKLASLSTDLNNDDYDLIQLSGDWARECQRIRRKVNHGLQGFSSTTGYSSPHYNPFLSLVLPSTTESQGVAYGFSLIYTGSFSVEVEKSPQGQVRTLLGMNPLQLSWPLKAGESLTSPEAVSVYSNAGIGDMSRKFHSLYRKHLMISKYATQPRPVLLNSWEGQYFNFDHNSVHKMAKASADLGVQLFVLDDGWFGEKYPRTNDHAGLGDWIPNPDRFPDGMKKFIDNIVELKPAHTDAQLQFGLWVEPEMVNAKSSLYNEHPDWILYAPGYPRTEHRNQLVLNLSLGEVQDFIIKAVGDLLDTLPITYIKWDNNRAMHEMLSPATVHRYMLGLYRVMQTLTDRFPDVLWEGCASGGGRFDPGILHYFPQIWTSDNTDPVDRIYIQFGTSVAYPASAMGAHICAVPNHQTGRITSLQFRAAVALMGGSFGFELDPEKLNDDEKAQIPQFIALAKQVNPIVVQGDMWRIKLPEESNHPAVLFTFEDSAVLFCFQLRSQFNHSAPIFRLQGLDPGARYRIDDDREFSGATLMNGGLQYKFEGDYDSKVVMLHKI